MSEKYTSIGVFESTKTILDQALFNEIARKGEKITYDEYLLSILKVKKQKC